MKTREENDDDNKYNYGIDKVNVEGNPNENI